MELLSGEVFQRRTTRIAEAGGLGWSCQVGVKELLGLC
jgi:hypothetical protein